MADMPYTKNPYLPKLRAQAVNLVRQGGWSMRRVARYIGVQPSSVSRWMRRSGWAEVREIPTRSSRPHHSPTAVSPRIVDRIVAIRTARKRCAQVVHAQLQREGIVVHLNTVKRTLHRQGLMKPQNQYKKRHQSGERPIAEKPGMLMETDTIHIYLNEKRRMYIFTLIDVCSRWAYAKAIARLSARSASAFIQEARRCAPFPFQCMQSDHGPEFSPQFTRPLTADGIRHRHIRVRKPNDNAHVERFNRTIQEDMQREIHQYKTNLPVLNREIERYLAYYNNQRLHMGINYQTPSEVLQRS